jgi:phosphate acetyltransferase
MSFRTELLRRAAANPARIVLAEGDDPRVQRAAERLLAEQIAEPIVIGGGGLDPSADPRLGRIANHLRSRQPDRVRDGVHALELAAEPLNFAASLVALGEADGWVGGATFATAEVVRAALWAIGTTPGVSVVSSSFYMAMRSDQVLTFTDCAVVPEPTSDQLAEIALSAVRARSSLVGDSARVAFLSYSTRGSAAGAAVERVRAALARFRELAPGVPADGEMQADAALVPEVCDRKAPGSPVGGRANVLVFPDLNAGNIAYKLVQRLAGAAALGPVLQGTRRPVADLSRGASADDIVEVAAMVALQKEPTTA